MGSIEKLQEQVDLMAMASTEDFAKNNRFLHAMREDLELWANEAHDKFNDLNQRLTYLEVEIGAENPLIADLRVIANRITKIEYDMKQGLKMQRAAVEYQIMNQTKGALRGAREYVDGQMSFYRNAAITFMLFNVVSIMYAMWGM